MKNQTIIKVQLLCVKNLKSYKNFLKTDARNSKFQYAWVEFKLACPRIISLATPVATVFA